MQITKKDLKNKLLTGLFSEKYLLVAISQAFRDAYLIHLNAFLGRRFQI